MEITEEKLYAAFGLNPEQGGKEQETAEPAGDSQETQGTEAQGEAEGQGEGTQETESQAEDRTGGQDPEPPEKSGDQSDTGEEQPDDQSSRTEPVQSEEQRRANAARRRQAETQAAIDAAVNRARQQWEQERNEQQETFFRQAGLVNPFTKEPITNMEEFHAWREEQDNKKLQKELQSGKLTKETLNALIEQNPVMQDLKEAQEKRRREAEQIREQAMKESVERQLEEIRKTDPSIRTVGDLLGKPYGQALYQAVRRGNNFVDAFYLATRGQAEEAQRRAAQQAAVNNITGKNHLRETSIGGRPGATVTREEREMYQLFNPKATDAEIQKFQNKFKKG